MMGRFVHLFTLCGFCLLFLRRETCAYNFEIGYEYHYEYKADSVVLADFQVLTIVKVTYFLQLSFVLYIASVFVDSTKIERSNSKCNAHRVLILSSGYP